MRVRSPTRASIVISNAVLYLTHPGVVRYPHQRQKQTHGRGAKPVGLVPRRCDDDSAATLLPRSTRRRCSNPARETHTSHDSGPCTSQNSGEPVHLVPATGGALESIAIAILVGVRVAQCREFKRDEILPIGQRQGVGIGNGPLDTDSAPMGTGSSAILKLVRTTGGTKGFSRISSGKNAVTPPLPQKNISPVRPRW